MTLQRPLPSLSERDACASFGRDNWIGAAERRVKSLASEELRIAKWGMNLGKALHVSTRSASATTVTFVIGVAGVIVLLHWMWTASGADPDFISTFEFGVWVGFCGATAGVWVVAFVLGWRELAALHPNDSVNLDGRFARGALALLALGAGAGIVMLVVGGDTGFEAPVPGWDAWQKIVPMVGVVATGPWVLATWWTHDDLTGIRAKLASEALTAEQAKPEFAVLRSIWPRVERCTAAMAAILTVGVLATAALRLALVAGGAAQVPGEQQVVAYGLFFALLVAVVVVPLLLSYRRRARQYLGVRYQVADPPKDTEVAAQVAELLYLSRGPFRDPWAVLGILTPALAGALAAYLPGLAS